MDETLTALCRVERLIQRPQDFLIVGESPRPGHEPPSDEHPSGRWALPVAIAEAAGWQDSVEATLRRLIIAGLPPHISWIRLGEWWCPPLWHVGHGTALTAVRYAIDEQREKVR